ncbi:hypothetical protein Tco_0524474 [Tanacetum coccineum]
MTLMLRIVTVPPFIGNLNIPCTADRGIPRRNLGGLRMCRGNAVISAGFRQKISVLLSKAHSSLRLFLFRVVLMRYCLEIITHSIGMTLMLRIVTVPLFIGNLNISCAWIFVWNALRHLSLLVGISGLAAKWLWGGAGGGFSTVPMSDVVAGIIWLFIPGGADEAMCIETSEDILRLRISVRRCPPYFCFDDMVLPFRLPLLKTKKRLLSPKRNSG